VTGRHLTTAVTMLVLVGILVLGVFVGVRELFAPLPGSSGSAEETPVASPSCEPQDSRAGRIRSRQVTVNVFNGGTRAGLAGLTLDRLATRGFRPGEAGNAPSDSGVKRVQVWIVEGEETAGRLVARNFGPKVPVVEQEPADDLGDGVDVVVGNGLARLAAPLRSLKIAADQEVCPPAGDGS
jgi:hypothetical protein